MGFFASRKAEDNDSYQVAIGVGGATNDKSSVVQVIRSRFYGKKGKEREDQPPSFLGSASTAQVLSPSNIPSSASNPVSATPTRPGAGPSILRNRLDHGRIPPATPSKKRSHDTLPIGQKPTGNKDTLGPSSSHGKTVSVSTSAPSPRKNADTVTLTLAQRLNELSVANSEGLLSDDEYRILRANLFERFSSNVMVPIETPVVPATPQARPRKAGQERPSPRPLSNFQVDRPLSISSKTSGVSGVADMLKRATGRRSSSKDLSDTSSIWSSTSNTSFFRIPKGLTRKSSNSSVRTNASRQADAVSVVSSRAPVRSSERGTDTMSPMRSAGSMRKLAAPPSSFPGSRAVAQETRNTSAIQNIFDEQHLNTVKDITQEILNVEAEAKRVMDAFSGLEVTTLAKAQRGQVRPSLKSADLGKNSNNGDSHWGQDSDGPGGRRVNLADDAISMRSGISTGTAPSMAPSIPRSAYSTKKPSRTKLSISSPTVLTISRPTSLHRKNSSSSVTSEKRLGRTAMAPPPVPALPHSLLQAHLKAASASNLSLSRSTGHLPMNTVPEDEGMSTSGTVKSVRLDEDLENEMDEIRRRREEVSHRYEARLEYLRAKLKGAQLHEKLMRK
ncbi:hypothetical protein BDN70DRAFT_823175 [Pholiota conissans]|uniref:Uncharacterized protein n=1 Tax=Pholiota conissans TaxID=109636 RepID=A0A9P5ZDU5_9AGAR|nr:hypothetical protein BDN70DRAFT_823175 [Pholiota conissans]